MCTTPEMVIAPTAEEALQSHEEPRASCTACVHFVTCVLTNKVSESLAGPLSPLFNVLLAPRDARDVLLGALYDALGPICVQFRQDDQPGAAPSTPSRASYAERQMLGDFD